MRRFRATSSALALLAASADAVPAWAQQFPRTDAAEENARERPTRVEEIIVTGRRLTSDTATNTDAPLIETPATVNVITSDFIEAIGGRRLEDIIQYTPGVSAQSVNNAGPGFNIRGFSVFAFGGGFNSDNIFIDGFRPSARRYHFDPVLYERIDILKGPSGLLYGTAAPGGIVRYVTKKPQFEATHRVEATVGSYDTLRGTLDSTGPLNEDQTLAYRLIVSGLDANLTNHGRNDDIAYDRRLIVNPQLTWRTPGGGELRLGYELSRHDSPIDPGINRLNDGSYTYNTAAFLGPDSFLERKHHIGKATFTHPVNENWSVHLAGSVGHTDSDFLADASFGAPSAANRLDRETIRGAEESNWHDMRAELRGNFHTGEAIRHDLTLGVSHFNGDTVIDLVTLFQAAVIDARNPVYGPAPATGPLAFVFAGELSESAVYLQDYVSLGDHVRVFGGLRYVDAENVAKSKPFTSTGRATALDYTLGAIYNATNWLNPFVSYATALTPQTGTLTSGESVPFREAQQIEIGNKSQWFDGRVTTTVSLFQIEQTNIAEGDPANPDFVVLAGDQRVRGVEFEAVGKITDQFSLLAGYSYLDAVFTESLTGNEGKTPHSVPRHKASLFGLYEFAGGLEGLRFGLGAVHVGERFGDNANSYQLPTYERLDAFVGYRAGRYALSLSVANLLNTNYIEGSGGFGNFAQGARRFLTFKVGGRF